MKREGVTLAIEGRSTAGDPAEVPIRIAIIISHAIQYFAPYYRALAATPGVILKVFFCRKWGAETYYDVDFRKEVKWDIPLLEGYEWEFLDSRSTGNSHRFWEIDNPNVGEALTRFRPDVVEVCGYTHPTVWRAVNWCRNHRVPSVLYSDSNASAKKVLWKCVLKAIVVKQFYRRLDGALASGDNNRAYHLRYGLPAERIYTRAMPIDCARLVSSAGDVSAARREIREKHKIPEDAFVVVYAGKLSFIKCPLHLLEAVHLCARQGHKVWGLLVGEGAQRPNLEKYIVKHQLNNAVLAGFVNQSAIAKYFAASDVVALMSSYEPKGQIVPEAGSLGSPAIVSDHVGCVGPNDCARPGVNALVYPWSDIGAFAECILRLHKDRDSYRGMSEAAVRIANLQDASVAAMQMKEAAMQIKRIGSRR
jgi:glycosyltransferase involved in cell wall biosynthesis